MTRPHGNNNPFARKRVPKGALRKIVSAKRIPSVVPGGHIRGHVAILTLECGHDTERQAWAVGARAHCETCTSRRVAA